MRKNLGIALLTLCLGSLGWSQAATNTDQKDDSASGKAAELQKATETMEHISATAPDKGVPQEVLQGAKCVAVIPKLIKGAFVIGGEHGTGVATCRTGATWSAPAPFSVSGISWGPQIGGKSTDLVMFIMNDEGDRKSTRL